MIDPCLSHSGPCSAENRTDCVLRDARRDADFVVGSALKVIHANDLGITGAEFLEESFDFFAVLKALNVASQMGGGLAFGRLRQLLGWRAFHDLVNDDTTRDHGQVGCQTALSAEVSKDGEIITDECEKDLRAQIVSIILAQRHVASVCRVVHNVNDKPEEAINEILPRAWLALQASLQQVSIDFRECHRWYPRVL